MATMEEILDRAVYVPLDRDLGDFKGNMAYVFSDNGAFGCAMAVIIAKDVDNAKRQLINYIQDQKVLNAPYSKIVEKRLDEGLLASIYFID